MIFVTVGTVFPFDRLIRAVDEAAGAGTIGEEVFAQVGRGGYRPIHMQWAEVIDREAYGQRMREASAVIGHAGTGTIVEALEAGKPLLVMPRLKSLGEHVNDHQVATARRFEAMGHVLTAYDVSEMPSRIAALRAFQPMPRTPRPDAVVARIHVFLGGIAVHGHRAPGGTEHVGGQGPA